MTQNEKDTGVAVLLVAGQTDELGAVVEPALGQRLQVFGVARREETRRFTQPSKNREEK